MNSNKSSTSLPQDKKKNYLLIQRELAGTMAKQIEFLEKRGYDVPRVGFCMYTDSRSKFEPKKKFSKSFASRIEDVKREFGLNLTEMGIIYTLSFHIRYEDNLLYNDNGTPAKKKDLSKILDLAHNAVDKYMASLVDKGVLAKVKVKRSVNYYLNPYIFYRGNRIDDTLLNMFNKAK